MKFERSRLRPDRKQLSPVSGRGAHSAAGVPHRGRRPGIGPDLQKEKMGKR
jgi:hypothetical protein